MNDIRKKKLHEIVFFYLPNKKSILFFIFNSMDFEDAFFITKDYEPENILTDATRL